LALALVERFAPLALGAMIGNEVLCLLPDGRRTRNRAEARIDARRDLPPERDEQCEREQRDAEHSPQRRGLLARPVPYRKTQGRREPAEADRGERAFGPVGEHAETLAQCAARGAARSARGGRLSEH